MPAGTIISFKRHLAIKTRKIKQSVFEVISIGNRTLYFFYQLNINLFKAKVITLDHIMVKLEKFFEDCQLSCICTFLIDFSVTAEINFNFLSCFCHILKVYNGCENVC